MVRSSTNWTGLAFDDRAWGACTTLVGYGTSSVDPTLPTTYLACYGRSYFRKTFFVADTGAIAGLTLKIAADNAALAYLNGVFVHNDSVWHDRDGHEWDYDPWNAEVKIDRDFLRTGTNVLAVAINNFGGSDMGFDAQLETAADNTGLEIPGSDPLRMTDPNRPLILRVTPERDNVVRITFNEELDVYGAAKSGALFITCTNDPAYATNQLPVQVGFEIRPIGAVDQWTSTLTIEYDLVVMLPFPMQNGLHYDFWCTGVTDLVGWTPAASSLPVALHYAAQTLTNRNIKVNQLGYRADAPLKYAYFGGYLGTLGPMPVGGITTWQLIGADTQAPVLSGAWVLRAANDVDTGETILCADFSGWTTPGRYYVYAPGAGCSPVFEVRQAVYNDLLSLAARSFYLARCGMPDGVGPPYSSPWHYGVCHTNDGLYHWSVTNSPFWQGEQPGAYRNLRGGWHDAADYGKYVVSAMDALWCLFSAYECYPQNFVDGQFGIPESNNGVPDLLDEIRYELAWLLKMQDSDGGVYHKVCTKNWCETLPENDPQNKYLLEKTTHATAAFGAGMAMAARVFAPWDQGAASQFLAAATAAWVFVERTRYVATNEWVMPTNSTYQLQQSTRFIYGVWLGTDTNHTGANFYQSNRGYFRSRGFNNGAIVAFSNALPAQASTLGLFTQYDAYSAVPAGGFLNPADGKYGGEYGDRYGDQDERAWCAAELYRTTGEAAYQRAALAFASKDLSGWSYAHTPEKATWALANAAWSNANITVRTQCRAQFITRATNILVAAMARPYRSDYHIQFYGTAGNASVLARQLLCGYYFSSNTAAFRTYALLAMDAQLGANALAYPYFTGVGTYRIQRPVNNISEHDGIADPVPGLVINGPAPVFDYFYRLDAARQPDTYSYPQARCYYDVEEIGTAEAGIGGQGYFLWAVAGLAQPGLPEPGILGAICLLAIWRRHHC
ncbi:MAG: glycoside hydrolase family 9 protein [bacterium]|nr:glycoside hydrolase family 9 protein [bacterium]